MKALGVVAALGAEARALGRRRPGPSDNLQWLGDGSLVALSGMGGAAALRAANTLIEAGVGALMTFGLSGGLDPALHAGSVVLPTEVMTRDGTRLATAAAWRERLGKHLSERCTVCAGALLTAERSIDSAEDKASAFRASGACAVDMESFFVARLAASHRLPFLCVRVIVDTAGDGLPRAVVAASRGGKIEAGRLLWGLLAAPHEVPALIRLARRYASALRALKMVAASGSLGPLSSEVQAV